MTGFGWHSAFIEQEWADVRSFIAGLAWENHEGDYLLDIIDSVVAAGADQVLSLTTSMHDLVVTPKPPTEPPLDVVIVCAPSSMRSHVSGTVRIEHLSVMGKNTEVVRPVDEAVALFWRFVEIEFGVRRQSDLD